MDGITNQINSKQKQVFSRNLRATRSYIRFIRKDVVHLIIGNNVKQVFCLLIQILKISRRNIKKCREKK